MFASEPLTAFSSVFLTVVNKNTDKTCGSVATFDVEHFANQYRAIAWMKWTMLMSIKRILLGWLIECCLASRKQYFSFIYDENKFTNYISLCKGYTGVGVGGYWRGIVLTC